MLAMGSPAKVRRPLTDEELAHNDRGVNIYLDYARQYREAGLDTNPGL